MPISASKWPRSSWGRGFFFVICGRNDADKVDRIEKVQLTYQQWVLSRTWKENHTADFGWIRVTRRLPFSSTCNRPITLLFTTSTHKSSINAYTPKIKDESITFLQWSWWWNHLRIVMAKYFCLWCKGGFLAIPDSWPCVRWQNTRPLRHNKHTHRIALVQVLPNFTVNKLHNSQRSIKHGKTCVPVASNRVRCSGLSGVNCCNQSELTEEHKIININSTPFLTQKRRPEHAPDYP